MELTLQDLKQSTAVVEGTVLSTYGYYRIGDKGGATYVIKCASDPDDGGSIIQLQGGLQAHLLPGTSVNYAMFGTVSDGVNDDGVQIKKAHAYANKVGLPLVNPTGEYWIKDTQWITIQTDVQWGQTVFHIDEKYNKNAEPKFQVISCKEPEVIELDSATKAALLAKLKPGTTLIPELAPYKNCLVVVKDDNDRIGIRYGNYNGTGWARQEFFYVEEYGRIIGDIAWTFNDYTSLTAYPCDDSYLTLNGGTFYLSGDNSGVDPQKYVQNGFVIRRSRTRVTNQWVGLEPGKEDMSRNARNGFYNFSLAYDVLLENVRLLPLVYDRGAPDLNVPHGTYGIGGSTVLCATFRNVTAEGSSSHWGVFGTNLFKNFRIEGCRLNRVDVHFHCWNFYMRDSEIGYKGLTLTGGGDLFIENTRCVSNQFLGMRNDYGAQWDGNIRLNRCRLVVSDAKQEASALRMTPSDFDYKYPIGYGKSVIIDDFTFDFTGLPEARNICWIMKIAPFSRTGTGQRLFFPSHVEFRNIVVEGRESGVRIMEMKDTTGFALRNKGGLDGDLLVPNCRLRFTNIQLEKLSSGSTEPIHFSVKNDNKGADGDEYSLFPSIEFSDCGPLAAELVGCAADVGLTRCIVSRVTGEEGGTLRGRLDFDRCHFKAYGTDDGQSFFSLESTGGTTLSHCTVYAPVVNGTTQPELVDRSGILIMNEAVKYNHVNTRLSKEIVDYFAGKGIGIHREFADQLRSRSDWYGD